MASEPPARASTFPLRELPWVEQHPGREQEERDQDHPPTSSTASISGLPVGTRRLSARPAKKAPTIPSSPRRSATSAADVTAASRKRKRGVRLEPRWSSSSVRPAEEEPAVGREHDHPQRQHDEDTPGRCRSPPSRPRRRARSASVSDHGPAALPTARWRDSPCSWTIGYETSVCEAQSDP